jgi:hypothetical protein
MGIAHCGTAEMGRGCVKTLVGLES